MYHLIDIDLALAQTRDDSSGETVLTLVSAA